MTLRQLEASVQNNWRKANFFDITKILTKSKLSIKYIERDAIVIPGITGTSRPCNTIRVSNRYSIFLLTRFTCPYFGIWGDATTSARRC
jgi:hypothetical protein